MPRLNKFTMEVKTASVGIKEDVRINFNGHIVSPDNPSGATEAGDVFQGEFSPMSYVHQMSLLGPKSGLWDIEQINMVYELEDEEPYAVSYGPILLDQSNHVNIWEEKSPPTFDV